MIVVGRESGFKRQALELEGRQMKKLIKQIIYRLLGDSRRDIIAELKHEYTLLLDEISSLSAQIVQTEQSFRDRLDAMSNAALLQIAEEQRLAEDRMWYR